VRDPHDRSAALEVRAAELRAEVEELRRELLRRRREVNATGTWLGRSSGPLLIAATLLASGIIGYLGWRRGWGARARVAARPIQRKLAS
jgi:hypothetical protein